MATQTVMKPARAGNVLAFPKPRRRSAPKARPAAAAGQLLTFTGVKRFVYDREELVAKYRLAMSDALYAAAHRAYSGELTGIALTVMEGDFGEGAASLFVQGAFHEDMRRGAAILQEGADAMRKFVESSRAVASKQRTSE